MEVTGDVDNMDTAVLKQWNGFTRELKKTWRLASFQHYFEEICYKAQKRNGFMAGEG